MDCPICKDACCSVDGSVDLRCQGCGRWWQDPDRVAVNDQPRYEQVEVEVSCYRADELRAQDNQRLLKVHLANCPRCN